MNRNLRLLWLGQTVSQMGDAVFEIGLLWLMLELTGSSTATGLVAMSAYLPALLFALPAGSLVDHMNRRRLMLITDGARALLVLCIPLLYHVQHLPAIGLGVLTFSVALCSTLFNPSRDALLPALVPRQQLRRANSLIQTSWQLALLFGPALGAWLIRMVGVIHLFTLDALSYVASLLFILGMKHREEAPVARRALRDTLTLTYRSAMDGLGLVTQDRRLRVLLLITAADNLFIMGPATVGIPIFIRTELGGGAEQYAFVMTAFALGMLLGTLLLNTLAGKVRNSRLLAWGIVLDGLTFLPLLWTKSLPMMYLVILLHSLVIPWITIPRPTLVQTIVPAAYHGRVFALINLCVTGLTALSLGLTGMIATWVSMPKIYAGIAIAAALCGIPCWLVREFRLAP